MQWIIAAVLILAVLVGYISAAYDFKMIVVVIAGAALFWSVIKWPRWGLVLIIAFMSTILAPEFLGSYVNTNFVYYAQEILLFLIVAASLISWSRRNPGIGIFTRLFSSPQMIAFTIFFAVVLIKALAIMIERRFEFSTISSMYNFNRSLTFYLLFIPVLLLLDTRDRVRWMVRVMYALGIFTMVRILLQLIFPHWGIWTYISLSEPLATETPFVDVSVQRLRSPGGTIVLACFWTGIMFMVLQSWTWKRLAFYVPFTLVMLAGMILEFNRSYILPMGGLLVLVMLLNRKNVRIKLLTVVAVTIMVLALLAAFTGSTQKYIDAATVRFGTALSSQSLESQSLTSRQIEQNYAWESIRGAPLFGIGLDEYYRPPVPGLLDNLRWYIHDTYIWFWTYYGIIGLGAFLAIMVTALVRSAFNWKRITDPMLQAALIGLAFAVVTMIAANFAAPKFYDYATVPAVAMILGLIEAIILSERRRDSALS